MKLMESKCLGFVQVERLRCLSESHFHYREIKLVTPIGNQPWVFIGRTDAETEAPILWPPDGMSHWKRPCCKLKIKGKRRRGLQRMRWLDSITNSLDMNLSRLWETVKEREAWHAAIHGVTKSQTLLSNWTTTATYILHNLKGKIKISESSCTR